MKRIALLAAVVWGVGFGWAAADPPPTGAAAALAAITEATRHPAPAPLTEIRSQGGVLTATLEAGASRIDLPGVSLEAMAYNGLYAGPLLRVHPGDVMRIRLVNHLSEPTNLHFHGYRGSPLGNSDNVHIVVEPGQSFDYEVRIPLTQPPGLYWYHAHIHHHAEHQIMAGLGGAWLVEGLTDQFPALAGVRDEVLVLKDYSFDPSEDPVTQGYFHGNVETINGRLSVPLAMRPGETRLLSFVNAAPDLPVTLALKGHGFRIIARDGQALTHEMVADQITIPPAGRVEALVEAGLPGAYPLVSSRMTGDGEALTVERTLAVLTVAGAPVPPAAPLARFPDAVDLRPHRIDAERTFALTEEPLAGRYYINGKLFDHTRVDTRVPLGNVEEWTIRNDSDDYHAFHIHQLGFQVVEINGQAQPFDGYRDTVEVPERGTVKIRLAFTDPLILGRFMYHCHVLEHEDKGMMGMIEVYDPKAEARGDGMAGMNMGPDKGKP